MGSTCVVGLQWGDEAKGKVVDLLTREHDIVVRYNGGANAGHTVVVGKEVYKLSLIPSGIAWPGLQCVIGNGTVIYPQKLLAEIDELVGRGLKIEGRLLISDRAHVILPYHIEEERLNENAAGTKKIGTTGRGIGPCYADKVNRLYSIRMHDLLDPIRLRERLALIVPRKNQLIRAFSEQPVVFDVETIAKEYDAYAERLRPFVGDTFWFLQHAVRDNKSILFEGAQGSLLDIDHGSYPFVTSSNSSACGIPAGCGVSQRHIHHFVGIVKAYTTRVGAGPFPTELDNEIGEHIRQEGREFGTVTGRPRRCGWLDLVACRYTTLLNGVTEVGIMLLDVLSKLDELKICVAYEIDGKQTTEFLPYVGDLEKCKPIYKTLPGWKTDLRHCRKPGDLPPAAKEYIKTIADFLQVRVRLVSVGPARDETVELT
jgi:adenylosuccinate synthase